MRLNIILLLLFSNTLVNAQEVEEVKSNKGKTYGFWGWNRGWYSNSDIHFKGDNYDFKLDDVVANDKQTAFDFKTYFGLSTITIPQTNFRIGYFINNNFDISVGVDHMKYVMASVQNTKITGTINDETQYDGVYDNDDFVINKNFLQYEHTDGLNYLNAEITRNDDLLALFKIHANPNKVQVNTLLGIGLGALMPKSNVTLWNNERNDDFHLAGYGFSAKVGLNVTFFKFLFFRSEIKKGFINMPDVRTSPDPSDRASQHFFFTQLNFSFGFSIHPFN